MERTLANVDQEYRPAHPAVARRSSPSNCSTAAHIRHTKPDQESDFLRCFESSSLIPTRQWPRKGGWVDWWQSLFRLTGFSSKWIGFVNTGRLAKTNPPLMSASAVMRSARLSSIHARCLLKRSTTLWGAVSSKNRPRFCAVSRANFSLRGKSSFHRQQVRFRSTQDDPVEFEPAPHRRTWQGSLLHPRTET